MLDIAWSELLLIAVVAVVVVGPKDLPRLMRTIGQWMGRARAMADQFRRSFDDIARQSELEDLRAEVMKMHNDQTLEQIQRDTQAYLGEMPLEAQAPIEGKPAAASAPPQIAADVEPELEADADLGAPPASEPAQPAEPPQSPLHRSEP
jgi:sec-independent protein translocase protein TatB